MADNNESNSSDVLMSFMNKQVDKSSSEKNKATRINKAKQALEESRKKDEEAENDEVRNAKKDSAFKASRYNRSEMKKAGFKDFIIMLPFIFLGVLFLFALIFKGGPILKNLISSLLKSVIGG